MAGTGSKGGTMTDKIIISTKTGGFVIAPLDKLKTPRAVLGFVLEALHRGGRRIDTIEAIKTLETHLGLDLGREIIPVEKRKFFDEK